MAAAREWIRPSDSLPPEGQVVEISILPNSPDVSRAKRLGSTWSVEREIGGAYLMQEPSTPAYWRLPANKQEGR